MQQIDVPLANGSLLIMEGFTQADWQVGDLHSILYYCMRIFITQSADM